MSVVLLDSSLGMRPTNFRWTYFKWIQIQIRISDQLESDLVPHQSDKLDPDPVQFANEEPKCMEYETI
jgi:hypothetical protein